MRKKAPIEPTPVAAPVPEAPKAPVEAPKAPVEAPKAPVEAPKAPVEAPKPAEAPKAPVEAPKVEPSKPEVVESKETKVKTDDVDALLKEKYQVQLTTLAKMGFSNLQLNLYLIHKYKGNVEQTVTWLIEMDKSR